MAIGSQAALRILGASLAQIRLGKTWFVLGCPNLQLHLRARTGAVLCNSIPYQQQRQTQCRAPDLVHKIIRALLPDSALLHCLRAEKPSMAHHWAMPAIPDKA